MIGATKMSVWIRRGVIFGFFQYMWFRVVCLAKSCRKRKKRRYCLWMFILCLIPFLYFQLTFPVRYLFKNKDIHTTCVIPEPDPYDPSIMKFVWDPEPLICDTVPSLMFVDTSGLLQYNMSSISYYGGDVSKLQCEYRICSRHIDDDHVTFTAAVPFTPPIHMASDFFSVTCQNRQGKVLYEHLLTSIALESPAALDNYKSESENQLSVVLFGLDSVSRSCAIRKLPKTFKYLTETLQAYDLKGLMKVGENTLPNIVPLLTGRRVWTPEVPITDYSKEPFDDFPLIWRNFSDLGYVTFLAEDMADISTFNYLTRGFVNPPTDHYMRPYYLGLSEMHKIHSKLGYVFRFLESRNINLQKSSYLCYGDKSHHSIQIEYVKKFLQTYKGKRRFLHSFLAEISHEYQNFLSYGDEDFLDLLKWMHNEGHLNNTLMVFFSDHGARIDEIRNTFVGRIEDRMPLVTIYLPKHIKQKYPELDINMQQNIKRLTTFFDLHQTLVDTLQGNFQSPTVSYYEGKPRGISLFRQIPASRSCADAWIPEHYCACYSSVPVNISTDPGLRLALKAIIIQLNLRLQHRPICAQLELFKIQEAFQIVNGLEHTDTENTGISLFQYFKPEQERTTRYFVVIETVPGHAIFEATYDLFGKSDGMLIGDIIRVNKYKNQADCISDKLLRPLCFCVK